MSRSSDFPTRRSALVVAAAAAISAFGCGAPEASSSAPERPLVVVSVAPQRAIVAALAGDWVDIEVLMPANANPALFGPGFRQISALGRARLAVVVGHPDLPFERAWLEPLLSERSDLEVVEAAAGIAGEDRDPHTWVVPEHASAMAVRIATGLRPLLPEHAAELDENLRAFAALASELDDELGALFAAKRGAHFFVVHPAWGHLANRYGLVQRAIEREGKPPSAGDLAQLIASARALGVQVVVAQPQFDATAARAVATAIGARVEFADPLAADWAQALRRSARVIARAAVLPAVPAAAAGEG